MLRSQGVIKKVIKSFSSSNWRQFSLRQVVTNAPKTLYLKVSPKWCSSKGQSCPCTSDSTSFRWGKYMKDSIPLRKLKLMMDAQLLLPPPSVRGMLVLDRDAFEKTIQVPNITVAIPNVGKVLKTVKKFILKMENVKPVDSPDNNPDMRKIILNPLLVKSKDDLPDIKEMFDSGNAEFGEQDLTLYYENWKAEDILKAVLPENQEAGQSYSIIGHILHLNLRDHVLPFKKLIGEVLLDKTHNVSIIVNKTNNIDSTYRNFQMETLAGQDSTRVEVKENGSSFTFDFAKVYWNPRLSTEHERIVQKLKFGDLLYDVMAGVGPFAIPAGRRKCCVLANDLNPHSYNYLVMNCSDNKVKDRVKCYNLDGKDFITNVIKEDLLKRWSDREFSGDIHITMNLPAIAVDFLPAFRGLFSNSEQIPEDAVLPLVHVYMFTPDAEDSTAIAKVAEKFGYPTRTVETNSQENSKENGNIHDLHNDFGGFRKNVKEVFNVRKVSPNKSMMRVSFRLSKEILVESENGGPPSKKIKIGPEETKEL